MADEVRARHGRARREDPPPPGPDPRARRQRVRRRQPDAVALRRPPGRLRHDHPQAAWRLEDLPDDHVRMVDLLIDSNLDALLDEVRPRTIFNCVAYGAYSFETDSQLIYRTNFNFVTRLLPRLESRSIACYVHAGSSSEYGDNAAGPAETRPAGPQQRLRRLQGRRRQPDLLLRQAQAVPLRQPPALLGLRAARGLVAADPQRDPPRRGGQYPQFVNPAISRDFVYVDDVTEAFVDTALNLTAADYGESFNIGTGRKTTIGDVAATARELFGIAERALVHHARARWDVQDWYANIDKARALTRLGAADLLLRRTEADHRLVSRPARQGASTSSRPRNSASTRSTASPRSSPATRTTWRSRSCTSGSRRRSPS